MNDQEIIALYYMRNEQAITETAKQYGRLCHTVAENILHDRQDTEECVSDAFLRVWNSIPPERPQKLAAYLCRITRNLALDRYRSRRRLKRDADMTVSLTELEDSFTMPYELPHVMTVEDFERYILAPMEDYFGVTLEMAEEICHQYDHPLFAPSFYLRQRLSFFIHYTTENSDEFLENDYLPLLEKAELIRALPVTATTDVYVMEPHTSESEQLLLYMILHATGVVPMDFEMMDIHYRKQIGSYDHREYASAYNSSLLIRSITLPSTLISTYEGVFHGWRSLTDITYDGTKAEFEAMFGDRLDRFDDDYNTMIANSRLGGFGIDGEGLDFYGQYLVVVHFSDGTQAIY